MAVWFNVSYIIDHDISTDCRIRTSGMKANSCFNNSPQFFNLAISKSNLLFASNCPCKAVLVSAAALHLSCNPPSRGKDSVAEIPMLVDKLSCCPVLTGFSQITSPGLSGIPSPTISSTVMVISLPSGNQRVVSPVIIYISSIIIPRFPRVVLYVLLYLNGSTNEISHIILRFHISPLKRVLRAMTVCNEWSNIESWTLTTDSVSVSISDIWTL